MFATYIVKYICEYVSIIHINFSRRPLNPQSMPPTNDEHANSKPGVVGGGDDADDVHAYVTCPPYEHWF